MSSLTGHLSLFATQSLKSIDKWMATANANLNGSLRVGFKESDITFGGNTVNILKETSQTVNGIQVGEQALTVGATRLDWTNGEIVSSTQDTHFAINGNGFFLVAEFPERNIYHGESDPNTDHLYLTRDGEFHWALVNGVVDQNNTAITEPVLVTKEGLLVMAENDRTGAGSANNYLVPITYSSFTDANGKNRPCVVEPDHNGPGANAPTAVVEYDELAFSKFGSTVLTAPTAKSFKTIITGSQGLLDRRSAGEPASGTVLMQKALESSNVNFDSNIAQLAALGKMYNGFVQVIKVYNSALDEVLGFIR